MEDGSPAFELVESFPPSGANYLVAIDQLKARFARDELLIEVYVRELLNLVLKQATKEKTGMSLSSLYDKLETQLRALETLGVTKEKYASMLLPLVESALPTDLIKVWERHRNVNKIKQKISLQGDPNVTNTYSDYLSMLLDFLRSEVESEERINLAQKGFSNEPNQQKGDVLRTQKQGESSNKPYTAAALYSGNTKEVGKSKKIPTCLFCDKSHLSQGCIKAQGFSFDEKKECVTKKRGCFACLKQNHTIKNCRMYVKCVICSKKHYPIMCPDLNNKTNKNELKENRFDSVLSVGNIQLNRTDNVLMSNLSPSVLLQTVIVKVVTDGEERLVRALLDSGSQRSYVLSNFAKQMRLKKSGEERIIQGVFGGYMSTPQLRTLYNIVIKNIKNSFECRLDVLEQNKICNNIPRLDDITYLNYLRDNNIIIYDNELDNVPSEIELLLGADILGTLLTGNIKNINDGLTAIETRFGWTVMGKYFPKYNMNVFSGFSDNHSIADLWNLDTLGIRDPSEVKTKEDLEEEILRRFYDTISYKNDRYEVDLPWIDGHPTILSNRNLALKRLTSNTKRLVDKEMFQAYEDVFEQWKGLGIIEEVTVDENTGEETHYLPHHAVIKESSTTTRIRPVFDALAKDIQGNSLNDCLEKGPNFLEMIPSLLLKFRIGMIGVISDIEKAFLQIALKQEDRDFLRFFWWSDYSQQKTKTYRHCRVVFGVKSSPFLLSATISYHLSRAPAHLKKAAEKLNDSFYVDNCVSSVRNEIELEQFMEECTLLMSTAKFNLRGWVHNVLKFEKPPHSIDSSENIVGVLGLLWNFEEDTLFCDIRSLTKENNFPLTKRSLLSIAQKLFDPIGFISPVLLIPKILLRETWQCKIDWDQNLPDDINNQFQIWLKQISLLNLCRIPRMICKNINLEESETTSIHVFCDASQKAYASCIYLRSSVGETTTVRFLLAKSRVAPKNTTLPRLELLGMLLGTRLYQTIRKISEFQDIKTYIWSDSMVALTWVKSNNNWSTFVANRVREMRVFSRIEDWNHVPGKINPADVASRGCTVKYLLENNWWNGPSWLYTNPEYWPRNEIICSQQEIDSERKKTVQTMICPVNISTKDFNYFSKYSKIIRMIGWIFRFSNNSRKTSVKIMGELTFEEMDRAEIHLLKSIQLETFGSNPNHLQNLQITEDNNGLWRIITKLTEGEDTYNFKYPILLPCKHNIIHKFIEEQHRMNLHAGVQALLNILREKYWILKARRTVRQIISKCIVCKRYNSKFVETPFAPLPRDRIHCGAAFDIVEVDLAGPLYLKDGKKCWIVLFTCAVYRAVHLELAESLSTETFILCLRRFTARRGRVSVIYSDNGTNFIGTNNLMNKIDWQKILEYSSVKKIKWHFNPPTAAWWGGFWERIVRMIKELLRRNLGKSILNFEELNTLLCECEAIINMRPLTYFSEDSILMPLSPSMFIADIRTSELPEFDDLDRKSLIKRHRYIQKLRDNFRSRFRKEYLSELANTGRRRQGSLKVGDIVYVGAENIKRIDWPLAKIMEIYPGRDNKPRIAKIKTKNGELIRPFQRLYPLEIGSEETKDMKERMKDNTDNYRHEETKKKQERKEERSSTQEDVTVTRAGRQVKRPQRFLF